MNDLKIFELKKNMETIALKFKLKLIVLFGSAARGRIRYDSDIDIGVVADSPIFELPDLYRDFMEALEPVESYYQRRIDVVQINSENIILLKQILREGILLYEYKWQYYNRQRLHWRFLVEDNRRYMLNYSDILRKKLEML